MGWERNTEEYTSGGREAGTTQPPLWLQGRCGRDGRGGRGTRWVQGHW